MFKNVLVGVDGRPTGRDAIALAETLDRASEDMRAFALKRQSLRRAIVWAGRA